MAKETITKTKHRTVRTQLAEFANLLPTVLWVLTYSNKECVAWAKRDPMAVEILEGMCEPLFAQIKEQTEYLAQAHSRLLLACDSANIGPYKPKRKRKGARHG